MTSIDHGVTLRTVNLVNSTCLTLVNTKPSVRVDVVAPETIKTSELLQFYSDRTSLINTLQQNRQPLFKPTEAAPSKIELPGLADGLLQTFPRQADSMVAGCLSRSLETETCQLCRAKERKNAEGHMRRCQILLVLRIIPLHQCQLLPIDHKAFRLLSRYQDSHPSMSTRHQLTYLLR